MSETSPNLNLPLIQPAQAQKHVTVNEALLRLDLLTQACVESRSLGVQPASPQNGQAWIVPDGATGANWSGFAAGELALYRDGAWHKVSPLDGWSVHVRDEGLPVRFDGLLQSWRMASQRSPLAQGLNNASLDVQIISETLTGLTGSQVSTVQLIPERAILLAVSIRVSETVTGATSFDCGLAGEASAFGGSLGVLSGSTNIGVVGPRPFYADTPVILTANGGDFTGGSVDIAFHLLRFTAPAG
ncbi:DUF2793 domain-containing protein [Maricaulis parjimensis]|uniref:DUF2793 domain-containing protein n=1 Tax=Maricaulis parjimensis TaxID=144023 RepID=UPI00193A6308|nr:DUF2793 domain-containing protein [Maricaulis parjimensis]